MKRRSFIATVLSSLLLTSSLIVADVGTAFAGGPIPGCPPAKHVTFLGPWDGGPWYFPRWNGKLIKPLRLAIVITWQNLEADSIKNHPRNPGQPPWSNKVEHKTLITPRKLARLGGQKARLFASGGEAYIYKNNRACRHNMKFEFRNGDQPVVSLGRLADLGLAYIY